LASRIPWETMRLGSATPALKNGLSRRYLAQNLSIAKWVEKRLTDLTLDVLLIVNPTRDLAGTVKEGSAIRKTLLGHAEPLDELLPPAKGHRTARNRQDLCRGVFLQGLSRIDREPVRTSRLLLWRIVDESEELVLIPEAIERFDRIAVAGKDQQW
ncbi:MAG: hypothetical protein JJ992_08320, partial [Planctomycetes bacterium]|nr:hypothetical protein [Planctomycetota bacterium]